jgi:hypothetical protein
LADEGARVALAAFGNLDETDPTVLPTVWEASLNVLTTLQVSLFKLLSGLIYLFICGLFNDAGSD